MTTLNPYGEYILNEAPTTIPSNDVAVFRPLVNSERKHDVSGTFQPEANNFCRRYKIDSSVITILDNKVPRLQMAENLLHWMDQRKPTPVWVFLCHGYTHGIQFGIRDYKHPQATVKDAQNFSKFTEIIARHPSPVVIFYACSTGDDPDGDENSAPGAGDDSFADLVRDELCRKGAIYCRTFAHTSAGPATSNPFIKLLDGEGSPIGALGGDFVANPGTKEFKRLQDLLETDFRFEIPFLTLESIRSKL